MFSLFADSLDRLCCIWLELTSRFLFFLLLCFNPPERTALKSLGLISPDKTGDSTQDPHQNDKTEVKNLGKSLTATESTH